MKQYVYQNNVRLIKSLYDSEFWKILRNDLKYYHQNNKYKRDVSFYTLNSLIEAIYVDPDSVDKALVAEMQDFYNEAQNLQYYNNPYYLSINNQKCSLDGLIGWKQLFKFRNGQEQWLDDYNLIRGSKMGHLAFPVQKNSINQIKGMSLGDRIDYTLFDIKAFYNQNPELRLQKAYSQETTRDWLKSFGSFNNFVDSMRLNYFVYSNTEISQEYNVIDLSKPYKNASEHCLEIIPQNVKFEENYVTNIIQYIKSCGEGLSTTHSDLMYNYQS